jgi:hypothetical protein
MTKFRDVGSDAKPFRPCQGTLKDLHKQNFFEIPIVRFFGRLPLIGLGQRRRRKS